MSAEDYERGIEDGLAYAAGFMLGAAKAAEMFGMRHFVVAFNDAARELGTVTVAQVQDAKR